MSSADFERLDALFHAALEKPASERARFVDQACGADDKLRARLRAMLAHDQVAADPLAEAVQSGQRQFLRTQGKTPQQIGPFRVLRRLGQGGMGSVWLAERDGSDFRQQVAIKLLHDLDDSELTSARLRRERQVLARLQHPNIARLVDGGELDDGTPWVAMEHVDGLALNRHAAERGLGLRARLDLFGQLLEAVAYAHRHLVVHRDIKPENALVDGEGQLKLLDFGIAKLLDQSGIARPSATMTVAGAMTPCYASPEQLLGQAVSTQSDVYSLGVVLYELLTGELPFAPDERVTPLQLQNRICTTQATPPSRVPASQVPARRLRGDLDRIVLKALRKEPDRRYASVDALAADLDSYRAGRPVSARPDSLRDRIGKFVARNPLGVTVSLLLLATVLAFAITSRWQATRYAAQRDRAQTEATAAQQVATYMIDLFRAPDPVESARRDLSARDLLDKAAASLPEQMKDAPALRARMMHVIGLSYANIGAFKPAERMLKGALAIREKEFGPDSMPVSDSLNRLGNVYRMYGQLDQAESALARALRVRQHLATGPNLQLADAYNNVGLLQDQLGHYQAALGTLQQSIDMHRTVSGKDTVAVAIALNNRALALQSLGRYREAEHEVRQAIRIKHDFGLEGRSTLVNSQAVLASLLVAEGRLDEARQLREKTLARRRTLYPQGHPSLVAGLINMARLQMLLAKPDAARKQLDEAMRWARKIDTHSGLLAARVQLAQGRLDLALGHVRPAREAFNAALEARRAGMSADNPGLARAAYFSGLAALAAGDNAAAAELLDATWQQQEKHLASDHPDRRDTQLALAVLDARRSQQAKGRTAMQSVIAHAPAEHSLRSDLITARAKRCLGRLMHVGSAAQTRRQHTGAARKLLQTYFPSGQIPPTPEDGLCQP